MFVLENTACLSTFVKIRRKIYAVYISVLFKKSVTYEISKDKIMFLAPLYSDALIFCLAYGITSQRVCGWSYEWVFITD